MQIRIALCCLFAFTTFSFGASAANLDVYAVAHQDDWQLFYNPDTYHELKNPANKQVFIYFTAGDAGSFYTPGSYAYAREVAALASTRWLAMKATRLPYKQTKKWVTIVGHKILKYTMGNMVSYFLHLPDGNVDGSGFSVTQHQSLQSAYHAWASGQSYTLNAVDGKTSYTGIEDVLQVVSDILRTESNGDYSKAHLYVGETDPVINPEDHSDHVHVSLLMQHLVSATCTTLHKYVEYWSVYSPLNVTGDDFVADDGTFKTLGDSLAAQGYYNTYLDPNHYAWIGRNYSTTLPAKGCRFKGY